MLFLSCAGNAFASGHCCLVITCWKRDDLLVLANNVQLCFCHFHMYYPGPGVALAGIDS